MGSTIKQHSMSSVTDGRHIPLSSPPQSYEKAVVCRDTYLAILGDENQSPTSVVRVAVAKSQKGIGVL
jgi:hypothetical protein